MRMESIDEIRAQGVTVYPHVIEDDGVVVTWDERNKRYVAHDAHCASIGATRDEAIANLKAYATRQQPLDVSQFNVPSWAKWVAADENGIVRAYAEEPIADILIWDADGLHQSLRRIDMTGIDWRSTLTPVNVEQKQAQKWCAQCNLPEDICRGHDVPAPASTDATAPAVQISIHAAALPGDVAETLFAQHSASWCERLIDELLTLLEAAKDKERHARIWDKVTQHLQDDEDMAQAAMANAQV
jgi:hypothetical protein